jgi:bifunctional non-homologous end joining protein LigD
MNVGYAAEAVGVIAQLDQRHLRWLDVGPVGVAVSHPERVFWPAQDGWPAVTQRDLLRYCAGMAVYILPHLRDRPLTLHRYPTGVGGKHFYQKHVETELPPYVERVSIFAEQHASSGDHVVCNNLATLLWLAQTANLELHPWYSRVVGGVDTVDLPETFSGSVERLEASVLNYPDFMVFDLDPYLYSGSEEQGSEPLLHEAGFVRTCETAFWVKDVLEQLHLRSLVKTSGRTGLHILVPVRREYDYDTIRQMAELICRHVVSEHPRDVTMEWSIERRRGKVFLDYNQNTRGKTLASAYSPRALPGAPVAVPLEWSELHHVYPTDFTMRTVEVRLARVGDLWGHIVQDKNDLKALSETLR